MFIIKYQTGCCQVSASSSTPVFSRCCRIKDMVKALLLDKKSQAPTLVKAVEESCVTCGGAHSYQNCPATDGNVYRDNIQEGTYYNKAKFIDLLITHHWFHPSSTLPCSARNTGVVKDDFQIRQSYDAVMSSGTLPSNTITNPKEDLKGITTRSGCSYQWTTTFYILLLVKMDDVLLDLGTILALSINLMPLSVWKMPFFLEITPTCMTLKLRGPFDYPTNQYRRRCLPKVEKVQIPGQTVVVVFDADPSHPYFSRYPFYKDEHALIDVYEGELTLRDGKEAITFNFDQTLRYSSNYDDMTANRINIIEMACEEYSQEILGFSDVIVSGNPTPYYNPIVSTSFLTLTPFGDSDFLLEEVDAFLALDDDPTSPEKLKVCEAKTDKSSVDEPLEVELKDLPPHLEYAFLEGDNKLPVIIAKDLSVEEKAALIKVLKSHKRAIAWKLSDIKDMMRSRCEDTNLCLNWEKSHFMVKEGIVLGHKISKNRIEVDKAKVDVIAKLPHPHIRLRVLRSFPSVLPVSARSVYGSLCPKISLCKKRFQGEIALVGSPPSRVHIQSD
ncbi:hypothetical protein Tco_0496075 [Tanacetum coccineum]